MGVVVLGQSLEFHRWPGKLFGLCRRVRADAAMSEPTHWGEDLPDFPGLEDQVIVDALIGAFAVKASATP